MKALPIVLLLLVAATAAGAQEPPDTSETVTLRIVDVEVVFEWGDYVRGLGLGDFVVRQGLEVQTVLSVDEICACGGHRFEAGAGSIRLRRVDGGLATACECFYRIGLEPYTGKHRHLEPNVALAERSIPASVRRLSETDHWWREGRAVLADPASANDIPIAAGIVPLRASDGGWDVSVQVRLDPTHLSLRRRNGKLTGKWEAGVLLVNRDTRKVWEMLGVSELRRRGKQPMTVEVLHRRTIPDLPPGRYELRTFVHDPVARTFGGDRASIELVKPEPGALAGPILMRGGSEYVATELPFRRRGNDATRAQSQAVETGAVPVRKSIAADEPIEFLTWICFANKDDLFDIGSAVVSGDELLVDFGGGRITRAGDCALYANSLEAGTLQEGRYIYRVTWKDPVELEFEIVPATD